MADFRSVKTAIWREDDWFQELPVDGRLLFIYLFTNPSASVAGIYKLPLRTMIFESGIPEARVVELLAQFAADGKVFYEQGIVWVRRMREHQLPGKISHQLITRLRRDIEGIPECGLKQAYLSAYSNGTGNMGYVYPSDTVSIPRATDTDTDRYTDTDTETDTERDTRAAHRAPRSSLAATIPADDMLFDALAECHPSAVPFRREFANSKQAAMWHQVADVLGLEEATRCVDWCIANQRTTIGRIISSAQTWHNNNRKAEAVQQRQQRNGSEPRGFENLRNVIRRMADGDTRGSDRGDPLAYGTLP